MKKELYRVLFFDAMTSMQEMFFEDHIHGDCPE